jgi:hypothetical protein
MSAISALFTIYAPPKVFESGDAHEIRTFWTLYLQVLSDIPADAIREGILAYNRHPESRFFPMPGPLRALCMPRADDMCLARRRIQMALGEPVT